MIERFGQVGINTLVGLLTIVGCLSFVILVGSVPFRLLFGGWPHIFKSWPDHFLTAFFLGVTSLGLLYASFYIGSYLLREWEWI